MPLYIVCVNNIPQSYSFADKVLSFSTGPPMIFTSRIEAIEAARKTIRHSKKGNFKWPH